MTADLSPIDRAKYAAARRSVDFVENGMKLGLGTGSTAAWMVRCLAERIRDEGLKVTGVPTSSRTADLARQLGVPIVSLDDVKWLDLTIDGADEFDPNLNLIKGGGAALLQEKIVATASDRMIVIADAAKEVAQLGAFPLPVEVIRFGWNTTKALIEETLYSLDVLNRAVTLRLDKGQPLLTDEGNYILDLNLRRIGNPRQLALVLNQIPGVVENGLFIDICDIVVIGNGDGRVTVRDINSGRVEDGSVDLAQSTNIFADLGD
jgi:ribose 5-phosphate isomerase A